MEEATILHIDTYRTAYGEKDGRYLLISTEDDTDVLSISTGAIGTYSATAMRFEQNYLQRFLELSGWDTTKFTLQGKPDLGERKLKKRFPMFSLSRKHLKDAGLEDQYIELLTDTDMQKIATHAGELLLASGSFSQEISFAAWNLILGTKLDELEETDEEQAT